MRKILPLLMLLVEMSSLYAIHPDEKKQLKQTLLQVNKYWQNQRLEEIDVTAIEWPQNEQEGIQLHLMLVHQHLTKVSTEHLTESQQQNRSRALDELKNYYKAGIFPKNTHHSYQIPYFMDDFGTACAVGQLLIKSGNKALAQLISTEDNYAYIEDMDFPSISVWAKQHGFTLAELKWIQPAYGPTCQPGTSRDPVCHDGVGCINPDYAADSLIPPYTEVIEYNDGSGWVVDSINFLRFYGARIGDHRITVTDSLNTTNVYLYTINNTPEMTVNKSITHQSDSNNCNGAVNLSINNGKPPYQIQLLRQNPNGVWSDSSGQFNNLCAGTYTVVIYDNNYCQKTDNLSIYNLATSIEKSKIEKMTLAPNPFNRQFSVRFDSPITFEYRLFRLNGKLLQSGNAKSGENIRFKNESSGLFLLEVRAGNQLFTEKILRAE